MSGHICLRCLARPAISEAGPRSIGAGLNGTRLSFSTSATVAAAPPKKKAVVPMRKNTGISLKQGRQSTKGVQAKGGRTGANTGERKALRKRVVLTNTNALEVQGLRDLSAENLLEERSHGQVLGLPQALIDALMAAEAFKPTQGWNLFRRPATLVRAETHEMARLLQKLTDDKSEVIRQIIYGERGSGKSVLALQTMAAAMLKGWVIIHIPEAQDLTIGHAAYVPETDSSGRTTYIQPELTANILKRIARSNNAVLSKLSLTQNHELPIPVQSNISLLRFIELGASDPAIAWPIYQAFLSEMTSPIGSAGSSRPPLLFAVDGFAHLMQPTKYLDADAKPIHAHDLALVNQFISLLSGKRKLNNGGMIVGVDSQSNRPSVPALDFAISRRVALAEAQTSAKQGQENNTASSKEEAVKYANEKAGSDRKSRDEALQVMETESAQQGAPGRFWPPDARFPTRRRQRWPAPAIPEWNAHVRVDERVLQAMEDVTVREIKGLSRQEARGIMEYYAKSGIMRERISDGLVQEKWTLAGNGIVGEIERGSVFMRLA